MDIVKMKIAELHPAKYNPRLNLKPGDAEWEHIQNSIKTFGYIDPIIVNKRNNIIVGGHQRYKILKSMGYDEIDCVLVDMDEQQERACNAALNKAQGDWDFDMLGDLLDSITEFDMSDFGFEIETEPEEKEITEDEVPEADEVEPRVKPGQIWKLGDHYLMCGDSTKEEDVLKLMSVGGEP